MQAQINTFENILIGSNGFPTVFTSTDDLTGYNLAVFQWQSSELLNETFLCSKLSMCGTEINNMKALD